MYYVYDMCPKCKDKLIKRCQTETEDDEIERYSKNNCEKCGSRLRNILSGEQEIDDTTYKIMIDSRLIFRKEACIQVIMKICGCNESTAQKKIETGEDILLCEEDALHTYLTMSWLDELHMDFAYYVTPKFPFSRGLFIDCPDCGGDTEGRTEKSEEEGYMKTGLYCEHCKQWVMMTYLPDRCFDKTIYTLEFSRRSFDRELTKSEKEEVEYIEQSIERCADKSLIGDKVLMRNKADDLHITMERLKGLMAEYTVTPPYPYKVEPVIRADEETLKEILRMNGIEVQNTDIGISEE